MRDAEGKTLSWENLMYVADFLAMANERHLSLLGGEPTLHPHFADYAVYLVERNFQVNIFTSGIMAPGKLTEAFRRFKRIGPERLSFVINMNHPDLSTRSELQRIEAFLTLFGPFCSPGFNIYRTDFSMDFLFDAISRYGMRRHIRIGLAHPIPGKENKFVEVRRLRKAVRRLLSYQPLFSRMKVAPGFDCGVPLCLFSEEELGRLYKMNQGNLRFGCGPAIDIGPDLQVWSCFPLCNIGRRSLFDFNTFGDLREYYQKLHTQIRIESAGIYEKCDTCVHREDGLCPGGCLAHIIQTLQQEGLNRFPGGLL